MSDLMRAVIDTLIPEGSAWSVAPDEDWDKLYDGMAENWETIRVFLSSLNSIRNPSFTEFLDELEQEFGVFTNPNLTEAQRRIFLKPIVYNRDSNGSIDNLQQTLDDAGFNVQVHSNDPAVDPALFISASDLLVNGDLFRQSLDYTTIFGNPDAVFGNPPAQFGSHTGTRTDLIEYTIPTDPGDWPLVFFVGGDATRDGSGFLTNIQTATVPLDQRSQFRTLILKYKPIHSWAGLVINYV